MCVRTAFSLIPCLPAGRSLRSEAISRLSVGESKREIGLAEELDFYEGQGHFIGERSIEINSEQVRGKRIFIASGARPEIPAIPVMETIDFLLAGFEVCL